MFNGRPAKPWGSFREGAANLEMMASDSRISKATRLIMLASFSLMTMTRMEVAVADPIVTQQVFQVEHVKIESTKKFAEVEAALDASIPQLDPAARPWPMVRKSVRTVASPLFSLNNVTASP